MIYVRKTNYHETDKMGVIHHSNYIKWLEEARIEYLNYVNVPYKMMEDEGVISPVLAIEAKYIKSMYFSDTAYVNVKMVVYTGVKIEFEYEIKNQNGEVCFKGYSKHCVIEDGKIISLKKAKPEWHELFENALKNNL